MPRHEPETKAVNNEKLAKDISNLLHGVMADDAAQVLGFLMGRILVQAKPEARLLIGEMHSIGMRSAAA